VTGRGELQIAILAENLRREGFEFSISRPEVILKEEGGQVLEPYELVVVDIPEEFQGPVIEELGKRGGVIQSLIQLGEGRIRVEVEIPARGLIGYRSLFLTQTKGEGVFNSSFLEYRPAVTKPYRRKEGALVSMEKGKATGYALFNLQQRGRLFIKPGDPVYLGMIVGENSRSGDLEVNPVKGKHLTNIRAAGSDEAIKLTPPVEITIEKGLEWIEEDELVEVTPKSVRLRKKILDPHQRKRASRQKGKK
jgi:GTP-binding protein